MPSSFSSLRGSEDCGGGRPRSPPTSLLTWRTALAGGAAVCQADDGGSRQDLWCWLPDASPGGAPARPDLPDVSRYLCLTPETLFQRKSTDHRLSLSPGIPPRPRLKCHDSLSDRIMKDVNPPPTRVGSVPGGP